MQVIGNQSPDVLRHAAVVEASLIKKKVVLNVTVQIYAAVTAHARIHMYPFIRTESCYYTDTESAVTERPPPESQVEPALAKIKLESRIVKAFFLALKVIAYITAGVCTIIKHKGPFKVNWHWFELQNKNTSRATEAIKLVVNLRINWSKLRVFSSEIHLSFH